MNIKKIGILGLASLLALNIQASLESNLDPHNAVEKLYQTCEYDNQYCEGLSNTIDNLSGKLITEDQLENYLAHDKQKSIFVPLELTNTELITLAAATSLGVVAFKNDQALTNTIEKNNSSIAQKISSVGNFYGSTAFGFIAAGSYFLGMYYDDNQLKKVGIFIVGAELAQTIVTEAVKTSFGRERPSHNNGPYNFFESGNKSFWSGHSASAFTLATVIAEMYKDQYPVVPYVAYGFAALTAYARVHDDHHWTSDVIIGAVAGHLIAKLALSKFNNDQSRGGLTFTPSINPQDGSFMLNFEWTPKQKNRPFECAKIADEELRIKACIAEAFEKSK